MVWTLLPYWLFHLIRSLYLHLIRSLYCSLRLLTKVSQDNVVQPSADKPSADSADTNLLLDLPLLRLILLAFPFLDDRASFSPHSPNHSILPFSDDHALPLSLQNDTTVFLFHTSFHIALPPPSLYSFFSYIHYMASPSFLTTDLCIPLFHTLHDLTLFHISIHHHFSLYSAHTLYNIHLLPSLLNIAYINHHSFLYFHNFLMTPLHTTATLFLLTTSSLSHSSYSHTHTLLYTTLILLTPFFLHSTLYYSTLQFFSACWRLIYNQSFMISYIV